MIKRVIINGVGSIKYVKHVVKARLKSPLRNFEIDEQVIEYRRDPLIGRWCRINILRTLREKHKIDVEDYLKKLVVESFRNCIFCDFAVYEKTPKFEFTERLHLNETLGFPNLYPFSQNHMVVIPSTKRHYIDLANYDVETMYNTLRICIDFFKHVVSRDPLAKYTSINMNYLFPAGASILHPHLQVFQDHKPTWFLTMLLKASRRYYEKYGRNFWKDYIESEEKLEERVFFKGKLATWFSAYAPIANYEVLGIINHDIDSIIKLNDDDIEALSHDIVRVLSLFSSKLKLYSINMSILEVGFSKDKAKYFRLHVRIVGRKNPIPNYVNDVGFMEIIHLEPVITALPEEIAKKLRN